MNLKRFLWWICLITVLFATVSAKAVVVNYAYDGAGRLIAADYGSGKSITYAYDLNGNLIRQSVQFSIADAVRILQLLSGMQSSSAVSLAGDMNKDGKIGMVDIIYILQTISSLRE
jgi:YD repeat-containing protein